MTILQKLLKEKGITLFQQDRKNIDDYYYEPFQDLGIDYDPSHFFETNPPKQKKRVPIPNPKFTLFRFFMDGTRKTYKIGDVITPSNKFMPVVVGQVRAGCCLRDDIGYLHKRRLSSQNYLLLSNAISQDDVDSIKFEYEKKMISKFKVIVDTYSFDKFKEDTPTNAAIAKIHKCMQDSEINVLGEMVNSRDLSTDAMLLLDGSLQFISQKFSPDIFYNVVGVSKHFNPNLSGVTKSRVHIGSLLVKLDFGERTPVIKTKSKDERYTYGAWYLKIRDIHTVNNPLEGVIKVEKMALNEHMENGFETSIIDNISAALINERIPTCHGNDERWANHLYPIYLTEKLVKSSLLSDIHFVNLF